MRNNTMFLFFCFLSLVASAFGKCGGTTLLTELHGFLSDGPENYPQMSECEWIIMAPENATILLSFSEFATECNYDFVFVFDGFSMRSGRKLAAFSGSQAPTSVLMAFSGYMLVHLHSDVNYRLSGIYAHYDIILACSNSCHPPHGRCDSSGTRTSCICNSGWHGLSCEEQLCPSECFASENQGYCNETIGACVCYQGYTGLDCGTPVEVGEWYSLFTLPPVRNNVAIELELLPRYSHTLVCENESLCDVLWGYGGAHMSGFHSDVIRFNISSNIWSIYSMPENVSWPVARRSHSAVMFSGIMFVFGGFLETGNITNELWAFDTSIYQWSNVNTTGDIPLGVMGHTASNVDDKMIVFGGYVNSQDFEGRIYFLDLNTLHWTSYAPGGVFRRGMYGHTAVWYAPLRSLIIFGGIDMLSSRRTEDIWLFNVDKKTQSLVVPSSSSLNDDIPAPRFSHLAVTVDDIMYIYGGNEHTHYKNEHCYGNRLYAFNISCSRWISLPNELAFRGRFSGAAVYSRFSHSIIIFGGFDGTARSDIITYRLPSSPDGFNCSLYTREQCSLIPSCGICTFNDTEPNDACRGNFEDCELYSPSEARCGSVCQDIKSCQACVASPVCFWCGFSQTCHASTETTTCQDGVTTDLLACRSLSIVNDTITVEVWQSFYWKGVLTRGMTLMSYSNRPDIVLRLPGFDIPSSEFVGGIRLRGFATTTLSSFYSFYISSDIVNAELWINMNGSSPAGANFVAHVNRSLEYRQWDFDELQRSPTFIMLADQLYYVEVNIKQMRKGSHVSVGWELKGQLEQPDVLGGDNVVPYFSMPSNCSLLRNCLSCVSDASCGWCHDNSTAYNRKGMCIGKSDYCDNMAIDGGECATCLDAVSCESCSSFADDDCLWMNNMVCFPSHYKYYHETSEITNLCPQPENELNSCTTCVQYHDSSYQWCESMSSCINMRMYTAQYPYGECTAWPETPGVCKSCSAMLNCYDCIASPFCGWCDEGINGRCVPGSLNSPYIASDCPVLLNNSTINSTDLSVHWTYSICPDIDECLLNLYECAENAYCLNIKFGTYICQCNEDFIGDGFSSCTRKCESCDFGFCSDGVCICQFGFSGSACTEECHCNNHSKCSTDGACVQCDGNTEGLHCEKCVPGFFGDPINGNCIKCNCNEHGSSGKPCDTRTGVCINCQHNTAGSHCEYCAANFFGNPRNGGRCYSTCIPGSRVTFSEPSGNFGVRPTNGVSNSYSGQTDCIWLIEGGGTGAEVKVNFEMFETECQYDILFLFDGRSFTSPLLAALSGNSIQPPSPVVGRAGSMLILFSSDINYEEKGFLAAYSVTPPCGGNNCSMGNGLCVNGFCECQPAYSGSFCDKPLCPGGCSDYGICQRIPGIRNKGRCLCHNDYTGANCEIKIVNNSWVSLFYEDNIYPSDTGRAAHTTVYDSIDDKLWVFGGRGSTGLRNDVVVFDFETKLWTAPNLSGNFPSSREAHSAVLHKMSSEMIVFGGRGADGIPLNSVYSLNIRTLVWTYRPVTEGSLEPVALSGHTATIVDENEMWIIGGLSNVFGLITRHYRYNIVENYWNIIDPEPGSSPPEGLYGHATVWDAIERRLIIFGGGRMRSYIVRYDIHVLDVTSLRWMPLPLPAGPAPMLGLEFSANYVDSKHVLVISGQNFHHSGETPCFDDRVWLFNLRCHRWVLLEPSNGIAAGWRRGRFSHTAVTRGHDVVVMGGFDGTFRNDVVVYMGVNGNEWCSFLDSSSQCLSDGECEWCPETGTCGNIFLKNSGCATHTAVSSSCNPEPGGCGFYKDCSACAARPSCLWCGGSFFSHCRPLAEISTCTTNNMLIKSYSNECIDRGSCRVRSECRDCLGDIDPLFMNTSKVSSCAWAQFRDSEPHICIETELLSFFDITHKSDLPSKCAAPCDVHTTCSSCIESPNLCYWCPSLDRCIMGGSTYSLVVGTGECTRWHNKEIGCPVPCSHYRNSSICLNNLPCGWCAAPGDLGLGACAEGTTSGPHTSECDALMVASAYTIYASVSNATEIVNNVISATVAKVMDPAQYAVNGSYTWAFMTVPKENECLLNAQLCHEHATCQDQPVGFHCQCNYGYVGQDSIDGHACAPICLPGCIHGFCESPGTCVCDIGWTGPTCNINCGCNGNSYCSKGIGYCDACMHNTTGRTCDKCIAGTYGDPLVSQGCLSCFDRCNRNSEECTSYGLCQNCQNNTEGPLCNRCVRGYTMSNQSPFSCKPCLCNGHASDCDPQTGVCYCNANTNTMGRFCEKCKIGYVGITENAALDGGPCFLVSEGVTCSCTYGPFTILAGETMFFEVHPMSGSYMQVDLRVQLAVLTGIMSLRIDRPSDESVYSLIHESNSEAVGYSRKPFLLVNGVLKRHIHVFKYSEIQGRYFVSVTATSSNATFHFFYTQFVPRMDLFVFFSFFFACFFLFLTLTMLIWRTKVNIDERQFRHERSMELQVMAHRPNVGLTTLLHDYDNKNDTSKTESINPVSLEYTPSGTAVMSVIVQLPCSHGKRVHIGTTLVRATHSSTTEVNVTNKDRVIDFLSGVNM